MPWIAAEGRFYQGGDVCAGKGKCSRLQSWLLAERHNLLLRKQISKLDVKIFESKLSPLAFTRTTITVFFLNPKIIIHAEIIKTCNIHFSRSEILTEAYVFCIQQRVVRCQWSNCTSIFLWKMGFKLGTRTMLGLSQCLPSVYSAACQGKGSHGEPRL